jgi:hypothetical protein
MGRTVRPRGLPLLALTALAAALAGGRARSLRADVVLLHDGARLEGKVVEESEEQVVIDTTFDGRKAVARALVKSVDTRIPPLRDQLTYRMGEASGDAARLWAVHDWAKQAGFKAELREILERIVQAAPQDARARKALGHVKVDGRWMTPDEQAAHEAAAHEAAMRAKGLVPYEGGWVTPEEKAAREKGLKRDGDEWITEEEWHRRRGETLVDGAWVRVGEAEGKAYADEASKAARVTLAHLWTPHFDVCHELDAALGERIGQGLEKAYAEARRVLRPEGDDLPETLAERQRVVLFKKAPAYARFAEWLGQRLKIEAQQPGWARAIQRQPAFWWVQDEPTVSVYQFPNIDKTVVSNAVHNAALVLLTRYRMNFRFPSPWLREGFAYHLEMAALGYTLTFTLGRGGGTNQGGTDTAPPWADSEKWKQALAGAVAAGTDPPLKRLAAMQPEELGYAELVKSWSVVDYLVRLDAAKFKAFVDGAKAARDEPEEEALTAAFGLGYRQLDEKWRAWVTGGFGPP